MAAYLGTGTTVSRSTKVKNIDKAHLALPFLQESKLGSGTKVGKEIIVTAIADAKLAAEGIHRMLCER